MVLWMWGPNEVRHQQEDSKVALESRCGEGSSSNMYGGPMDKGKGGVGLRWEVGVGRRVVGEKWRQLSLNNNNKKADAGA